MQMFDMAIEDCEKALEPKPDFAKAFSKNYPPSRLFIGP
jgi:hypothetical protein